MTQEDVTTLTTAFNPSSLLDTFVLFAPFIFSVVGIILGITLAAWGVRKASRKLGKGL